MNKHTSDTLKFYLGKEVYLRHFRVKGKLFLINAASKKRAFCKITGHEGGDLPENVYPILKTADQLTDEKCISIYLGLSSENREFTVHKSFEIVFKTSQGDRYKGRLFFEEGIKLINLGYGAIPDEKSPTGYVDLFGMPCVTPEMTVIK